MTRPTWDEYFLNIAEGVSLRSDCTRRMQGTVIVRKNRIVATGYIGVPVGALGCLSGGCPRGQLSQAELAAYTSYDSGPGLCVSTHSEANALLYSARNDIEGGTLYTWGNVTVAEPCFGCWKLINGSGVARAVWQSGLTGITASRTL